MKPITRFSLHRLRRQADASRVLDENGRIRCDHPGILADPEFAVRGPDGTIRHLTQSQMLKEQRDKWPKRVGSTSLAVTRVTPPLPSDAGPTADFSPSPYMLPPFTSDQGTQRNLADCYFIAPLTSFARLRPSVIWTAGKQLGPAFYRTRFYRSPTFPSTEFQSAVDVISDAVLPTSNFDDVGDDGSIWVKLFARHYAYARTGENTYASLAWGFAGQTMLDLGVFPTTISTFDPSLVTTMMAALTNNPCVCANSYADTDGTGIVPAHVYSIEAVRPNTNPALVEIDLNNPWKGYGATTIRLNEFRTAFSSITVGGVVAFPLDPVFTPFSPAPAEPDYKELLAKVKTELDAVAVMIRARRGQ